MPGGGNGGQEALQTGLGAYGRQILEKVERFKTYPLLSLRRREEGMVMLRLVLSATGDLLEASPVAPAPARLIAASMAAVHAAAPFPPPPLGSAGGTVAFDLPITYRMQ